MRPELSILSFLCASLLLGLAFLHAKSQNVAVLALISWLLIGNIIQGVDSIIWSANETVRLNVWCDISSKLLLGSRLALPAACTCICVHLHYLSSMRNTRLRRNRVLIEFMSCLILPLTYMALHTIVQDHRFVLAEDFGCVASVYTSTPALILVWIPPIILSITSIVYGSLALWRHTHRNRRVSDRFGIPSRLITVTFLRPLLTAVFTSLLTFCVSIFDIYASTSSAHGLRPWTSLAHVHANLAQVLVLSTSDSLGITRIEVSWWIIPASTLVFSCMAAIGLVVCASDESITGFRSARKWFRSTLLRQSDDKDTFIQSARDLSRRLTLNTPTLPLPVHLSGNEWDDSLRESGRSKPKLAPIVCDVPPPPVSPNESESDCDASFKAATLAYLQSPTGRETIQAGLRSQASSPTSGTISQLGPRWSTLLSTPPPAMTHSPSASPANSILSSPWPQPPSDVPVSPQKPSPAGMKQPVSVSPPDTDRQPARPSSIGSLTGSLASIIDASGYIPDPDIFLHSVRSPTGPAPFQHAGIPAAAEANARPSTLPRAPRRVSSQESLSSRSISLGGGKRSGGFRKKESYGDAVYMTVVHETQAV
ncbi:pheromone A receptor-domain-containing protein [Cytidiella melzeri]|nr:pheromone A receptor-domain-containing protein [Cytidiella melzeri]